MTSWPPSLAFWISRATSDPPAADTPAFDYSELRNPSPPAEPACNRWHATLAYAEVARETTACGVGSFRSPDAAAPPWTGDGATDASASVEETKSKGG
jgi:hypothetical protein